MFGNSIEEGLMLQVGNPSHSDIARNLVPLAVLTGVVSFYGITAVFPEIWFILRFVISGLVGILVSGAISWIVAKRREAARAQVEILRQHEASKERDKQIAEMNQGTGK